MRRITLISLFAAALVSNVYAQERQTRPSPQVPSQNETYYDELYMGGTLRTKYEPLREYLESRDFPHDQEKFLDYSREAFHGDNAMSSVPRILTAEEAEELNRGVRQRAEALRAFLQDHFSGEKTYLKAKIIPQDVLQRVLKRTGDDAYEGLVDPKTVSFMYGPDILRDARGQWRVIEDNPGYIGGVGDLKIASDLIHQKHPGLREAFEFENPMDFYRQLARAYREKAAAFGGRAVLYMEPPYPDYEDHRLKEIFAEYGVETVTPRTQNKLIFTDEGAFLVSRKHPHQAPEKVGFIFLNGEHSVFDKSHPASRLRAIVETANEYLKDPKKDSTVSKKIVSLLLAIDGEASSAPAAAELERVLAEAGLPLKKKSPADGLVKAILSGKVASNYSPGLDFIGDKEFYLYVESLVRFYLKQEPILKNIPTDKFLDAESGRMDQKLADKVLAEQGEYVIKKVDGRGGDSVWVGRKVSKKEFQEVLKNVAQEPGAYIAQKFLHLSMAGDDIVDVRGISAVLFDKIITGGLWGRGVPRSGNGKVNLSDKGREYVVLVIKRVKRVFAPRCEAVFR